MASGKLGSGATAAANTPITPYTCPAATVASATVRLVNRGGAATTVSLAISTSNAPVAADYIEYGVSLPANGVLEETGLVIGPGENVIVQDSAGTLTCRVHGFEGPQ